MKEFETSSNAEIRGAAAVLSADSPRRSGKYRSGFGLLAATSLLIVSIVFAGCDKPKLQLNIFIWSDYLDPKVIAGFEQQYDCKVAVDLFESPESMMAKLDAGGTALYDIVVPSNANLPALTKRGLLAPLRHENIPNLRNLDPRFANPSFDLGNQYGAPYQWGTVGLYVRRSNDMSVAETWSLIFDASKQPGQFLLIDDLRSSIGAALKYKGYSLNSTNPGELMQARDLLVEAKKRSLGFEGAVGAKNRVLARGAVLAMDYNNDAARGMKEDAETHFFVPREGGEMWMDVLSIPAKSPHRDLAEKFINYILEPKVGAQVSEFTRAATPNQAALEFINPSDRTNSAIYPPPEIMARLEYANDLGDANKLYDELWTHIKSK